MPDSGPQGLATLYMEVIPKAMREYRKEMRQSRTHRLTVPQFRILAHLRREHANIRSLAEFQGVSVAAMSRMVDWLCKHGFVERFEEASDRRQVHVQMTKCGRERFEECRVEARERLHHRLQALSPAEQAQLTKGLEALRKSLKNMGSLE
jgi:DNA-binding MarR family transcriptional regulator